MLKNAQKVKALPTRSIANPGDDHGLGMWVDYELIRRHQNRTPMTILHDALASTNNRYLELADIALGTKKQKKKSKAAVAHP